MTSEISIQQHDFSLADEVALLEQDNATDGAVVTFTGRVRNNNNETEVSTLTLEHYPGMTEKSLAKIITTAKERWNIGRVKVIHRIGALQVGEQIVFVGVSASHRAEAFQACDFIMDYLKSRAAFWKKETQGEQSQWVSAKEGDALSLARWSDSQV